MQTNLKQVSLWLNVFYCCWLLWLLLLSGGVILMAKCSYEVVEVEKRNLDRVKSVDCTTKKFNKHRLGRAPPGSKIIWHNDPSGAKEIPIQAQPVTKYAKKPLRIRL